MNWGAAGAHGIDATVVPMHGTTARAEASDKELAVIVFEWTLALLFGATLLTALARRIGIPYPVLLALGGAALAFAPGIPSFSLDPKLALALFVAPVLLDAAYDASPRDLKDNWVPISCLVLVAIVLTTLAVAAVAVALVPAMPLAAAVALGAIVAPPDAAAATAVLRSVNLPHRLLVVLEGESLFNDASALLIYRLAVAAVAAGGFHAGDVAPVFLFGVFGSVALGWALARFYLWATASVEDRPSAIVLQFVATFGVWILAERIELSGIITVVTYGIAIARVAPRRTTAVMRIPSYAVWETVVFVLQVLAFVLIGLQLQPIVAGLTPPQRAQYGLVALAVLAVVLAVRIAWVMTYNTIARWAYRRFPPRGDRPLQAPTVRSGVIVSWCGMRGIVTLAAAYGLPEGFPYRDLILLSAFSVVLGTLVIQGLTLRPLLRWFKLRDDQPVQRETTFASTRALEAALQTIDGDASEEAESLRREYHWALEQTQHDKNGSGRGTRYNMLRRRAIGAARSAILELRRTGQIGDDAFHRVERELDQVELGTVAPER